MHIFDCHTNAPNQLFDYWIYKLLRLTHNISKISGKKELPDIFLYLYRNSLHKDSCYGRIMVNGIHQQYIEQMTYCNEAIMFVWLEEAACLCWEVKKAMIV